MTFFKGVENVQYTQPKKKTQQKRTNVLKLHSQKAKKDYPLDESLNGPAVHSGENFQNFGQVQHTHFYRKLHRTKTELIRKLLPYPEFEEKKCSKLRFSIIQQNPNRGAFGGVPDVIVRQNHSNPDCTHSTVHSVIFQLFFPKLCLTLKKSICCHGCCLFVILIGKAQQT